MNFLRKTEITNANYYKNAPRMNFVVGILTFVLMTSLALLFSEGMEVLNAVTSVMGYSDSANGESLVIVCVCFVLAIVSYLIRRKVKRNIYQEMESRLGD